MADRFVIIHRSFDPVQAEMLGDVLRDAGVAARVIGTRSGASIGVGQVIVQVHIEVPPEQAGQATDLLESFLAGDGEARLRAEGAFDDEDGDDDAPAPRQTPRRPLLAVGVALLMPLGAGHLYAGRPWTAAVIFAGQLAALRVAIDGSWRAIALALGLFLSLLALDVIGAVRALAPGRRAWRPGPARQLATGAGLVGLAAAIGALLADRSPAPEWYLEAIGEPAAPPDPPGW